ncbi:WD40/YVTN/BNR-like repeat-containing protein [Halobaculum sp. MBLA0147]|uniref:WD40/YVTN/BNR-like repeat-containing protein n=1 Tax=Halobaculum sp. MBLA0147 TaxID=3079934 RepID=UPI003524B9DC
MTGTDTERLDAVGSGDSLDAGRGVVRPDTASEVVLLAGTRDGLYRVEFDGATACVLDTDTVHQVCRTEEAVYAATADGLYRSRDGETWQSTGLGDRTVVSVTHDPSSGRLYAGVRPAQVAVGSERAATPGDWRANVAFARLAAASDWSTPGPFEPQVRTVAVHPGDPDRIVVGVESEGAFGTTDGGESWQSFGVGLHDDVHHLRYADDGARLVAATGGGLYQTRATRGGAAGSADTAWTSGAHGDEPEPTEQARWVRLDTDTDRFRFGYHREVAVHDGELVTAALNDGLVTYEDDVAAVVARYDGHRRQILHEVGAAFPLSWASLAGRLFGGTRDGGLLRVDVGGVERCPVSLPSRVKSLAVAPETEVDA